MYHDNGKASATISWDPIGSSPEDCQMVAEIVDLDDSGYVDFQAAKGMRVSSMSPR